MSAQEALAELNTDFERGLTRAEVLARLKKYGPNELIERAVKSPWLILWEQLSAVMVVILIIAAVISAAMGDYKDAAVIMAIVALNTALGFSQEYRAEKAIAALKKLSAPVVKARRDSSIREIPASQLIPGDIIMLEAGNLVPADCRLIESVNLRAQESALTGESEPSDKVAGKLASADIPINDRHNMVYMGTVISYGRGFAAVAETGMNTELGKIAAMIQTVKHEPTPLQLRLDRLGRKLGAIAVAIAAAIFILGLLRGENIKLMFLTAISMAVAAVPEGLPAVVTIALALGAQRMLKRRALVRKLSAVETLGSVTVICSDKTGTLTENRMTVTVLDMIGHKIDLSEHLKSKTPFLEKNEMPFLDPQNPPGLALLLTGAALCNDALLRPDPDNRDSYAAVGDPTEGALVVAAARLGLRKENLEKILPRENEIPFDSERKLMTTIHKLPGDKSSVSDILGALKNNGDAPRKYSHIVFTKGAVDSVLNISTGVIVNGEILRMDDKWRERILSANDKLAQSGMRVLGAAFRQLPAGAGDQKKNAVEEELVFMGIIGMIDPPRAEVKEAVEVCKSAGIRPVMITGDHPLTAKHIARQLGIAQDGRIVVGSELSNMSVGELESIVDEVNIYARVSPEHKLKIVRALQNKGHIVAMTGDGVNDAPALKKADIGIAMGITGTDVSKEASDMVLTDDNFATIVAAVKEGRVIYDNIRKFIKYLLSTNSAELWLMFAAPFIGMPLPMLPLQILWINLITDGAPALALGVERAERGVMARSPYGAGENIFAGRIGWHILWAGFLMAFVSLGMGYLYWKNGYADWRMMAFNTLAMSQLCQAVAIRSERDSLFTIGVFSNKALLWALVLTFAAQMGVLYIPFMQELFKTSALSAPDLILSLAAGTVIFWAVELEKWFQRRRRG